MITALALAIATTLPTILINVHASPTVSRRVINAALEEADAIWRQAGMALSWRIENEAACATRADCIRSTEPAPCVLTVTMDDDPGTKVDGALPIGWVNFDGDTPKPDIHLSYANVLAGLAQAAGVRGTTFLPKSWIEAVVARALGRALAHEIGHYLLGSELHSSSGLMHADWSAQELFDTDRPRLHLDRAQRQTITSKIMEAALVTKR